MEPAHWLQVAQIALFGAVIPLVGWAIKTSKGQDQHSGDIAELKSELASIKGELRGKNDQLNMMIIEIRERLIRIETKLENRHE